MEESKLLFGELCLSLKKEICQSYYQVLRKPRSGTISRKETTPVRFRSNSPLIEEKFGLRFW